MITERSTEEKFPQIDPYEAGKKGDVCASLKHVLAMTFCSPLSTEHQIDNYKLNDYVKGLGEFLYENKYQELLPAPATELLKDYFVLQGFVDARTLSKPKREFPSGLDFKNLGEEKFNAVYNRANLYKSGYMLGFWVMAMADYGVNLTRDEIPRRESTFYAFMAGVTESNLDDEIARQTGYKLAEAKAHSAVPALTHSQPH